MTESDPALKTKKPTNAFFKPLRADFKELFKALAKCIGHTVVGKWEEVGSDAVETLSAIGISTEPDELAFLLIRRAITKALFDLVGESACQQLAATKTDEDLLIEKLDFSISVRDVRIDTKFLERPSDLPLLADLQSILRTWLVAHTVPDSTAKAIADRLPGYFVYALNKEWRQNAKSYAPLLDAISTPFTRAGEREWAWAAYTALLEKKIQEGIFDEPFGLSQIFVQPNAYYLDEPPRKDPITEMTSDIRGQRRVVVELQDELEQWLQRGDREDSIRVISGGPGRGKSSFSRIFAARIAAERKIRVLFVPLHLVDPSKDLVGEVGRFVKDEGVLLQNPLDSESPEPNLLIIFDGLDELATQGTVAAEIARNFVREVERTVEKRNLQGLRLRVIISGRELVVQENQSEFRRARQVLNLLPYFIPRPSEEERATGTDSDEFVDPKGLLRTDLRQSWWKNYGALTGQGYAGLPKALSRADLDEITAQPLLNYLVALSFTRDKLDFSKGIELNSIYADLVVAVHERAYEKRRPYGPIRHMKPEDFSRVLEEIGLAAWHGDGRTTTVREIEEHCRASGVGTLLDAFAEGAKAGVTRLLAAFFFRQYGQRQSGDATFVFTHKSFGEYLAARRVRRAMERVVRELRRRVENPDDGWDEKDALKHWTQVCGPSAISSYIHIFLVNEVKLLSVPQLTESQGRLSGLLGYVLTGGIPMEGIRVGSFKEAMRQARNAEEALLVALNACARATERVSDIGDLSVLAFGTWFKRIQGQRTGPQSVLAASCLSYLNLSNMILYMGDFYNSDMRFANLKGVGAQYANFGYCILAGANMQGGIFSSACMERANLADANLSEARVEQSSLAGAMLTRAILRGTNLSEVNFKNARLQGASMEGANLKGADFRHASLATAVLRGADLRGANFDGADLTGARLEGAKTKGASFRRAKLDDTILQNLDVERGKRRPGGTAATA